MSRRERNWRFYGKRHLFRRMPGKRRSSRKPAEVSAVGILRKHSLALCREVSVVGLFMVCFPQVDRSDEAIAFFFIPQISADFAASIKGSNRSIRDTYLLTERRTIQIEWNTSGWIYVSSMWYGRVYIRTTIISFNSFCLHFFLQTSQSWRECWVVALLCTRYIFTTIRYNKTASAVSRGAIALKFLR